MTFHEIPVWKLGSRTPGHPPSAIADWMLNPCKWVLIAFYRGRAGKGVNISNLQSTATLPVAPAQRRLCKSREMFEGNFDIRVSKKNQLPFVKRMSSLRVPEVFTGVELSLCIQPFLTEC